MPRTSARLDVVVVPDDPDHAPPIEGLRGHGAEVGWWTMDGRPGPLAGQAVQGGFGRVRLERWPRARLYANQLGGFRVRCPSCGTPAVAAFAAALRSHRAGGGRDATCGACGSSHALEGFETAPPARLARTALVLEQVGGPAIGAGLRDAVTAMWGSAVSIARRPG